MSEASLCPFLEGPVNFSGPKSHFKNCGPLILKSWSFTMTSRYERANLLQNFMPGNVFVFETRRKLWHPKCARKLSDVSRNARGRNKPSPRPPSRELARRLRLLENSVMQHDQQFERRREIFLPHYFSRRCFSTPKMLNTPLKMHATTLKQTCVQNRETMCLEFKLFYPQNNKLIGIKVAVDTVFSKVWIKFHLTAFLILD